MLNLGDKACDIYGDQSIGEVPGYATGSHLAACDKNLTIWLN